MLNLPLNALRALAYVYQADGVRPASRLMGVSHSAVSRHIRDLEEWLGTALLETQTGRRKLVFTANGKLLAEAAQYHLQSLDTKLTAIREAKHDKSLVISTTASFAARWLLPRLAELPEDMEGIEVSVLTEQRVVEPDGDQVDIAIRMGQGPWAGELSQPLMDDRLYPVVHPKLLKGLQSNPSRLFAKLALIHDRDPDTSWKSWFDEFPMAGVDIRKGPRFTSSDLTIRAAKNGLGMALVRHRLAADEVASGSLVRPFGEKSLLLKNAYWITRSGQTEQHDIINRVVQWLIDQAVEQS